MSSGMFGMSAEEIYENFRSAPGGERLAGAADAVRELVDDFDDSAASIKRLMGTMESVWRGAAAGAARRGAGPMVVAHSAAVPEVSVAQDLSHRQVGSFDVAKNSVVPVPPMPERLNPWPMLSPGEMVSYGRQKALHDEASQRNVDAMVAYEDASAYNTDGMPGAYGSIEVDDAGISVAEWGGVPGPGPVGRPPVGPPPRRGVDDPGPVEHGGAGPIGTAGPPQSTAPEGFMPPAGGPVQAGPDAGGPAGGPRPGTGGFAGVTPVPPGSWRPGAGFGGGGSSGGGRAPAEEGRLPGRGREPGADGRGRGAGREPEAGGRGAGGHEPDSGRGSGPRDAGRMASGERTGGRGGVGGAAGAGGVPVGPTGSPADGEDYEHVRPEWLLGGDPDELFGPDELTPPAVIGAEEIVE